MEKLEIIRGDDFELKLEFDENITGATVFFTAKKNVTDTDDKAVLKKTVTSHTDAANGKTAVRFSANDTKDLKPGSYIYDVQIKAVDNSIESWPAETLYVKGDITERTT
jgi:hypothetical protein